MNDIKQNRHMSDAFVTSVFLALSGGFQDAYTFFVRDKVFSNAQTGNVVLLSTHMMQGEYAEGIKYLFPIIAFALGIFIAERISARYKHSKKIHWRQMVLILEIAILIAVGFIGKEYNMIATMLVSLSCAMQVQTFRKVNGYAYASTMCIGNLRSGTESLSIYLREKKAGQLRKAMHYFGVIFFFAIGAGVGGRISMKYGIRSIFVSPVLLGISFLLMHERGKTS